MVALDEVENFLVTILWTSKLAGHHPLSVIIQAPSAGGKSSIIKRLRCPVAHLLSDMTTREISNSIQDADARFILLSDMQAIFAHKNTVVSMTVQAIRNLSEEGYFNDPFNGKRMERQMGFIMGVPSYNLSADAAIKLQMFTGGDISTRFVFVQYDYKRATILKIHEYIEKGAVSGPPPVDLPGDSELVTVSLTPALARKCRDLALNLQTDRMGTRIHHHVRTLVLAHACRHGRETATQEDFDYILNFSDYIAGRERKL